MRNFRKNNEISLSHLLFRSEQISPSGIATNYPDPLTDFALVATPKTYNELGTGS